MNKILKRTLWTIGALALVLFLLVIVLGSLPTRADPVLSREEITVGSQIKADAATGLDVPFPAPIENPDNPSAPEKVALGRLLFFDPVLSGENNVSCATCHHPDAGFSNASRDWRIRNERTTTDGTRFPQKNGTRVARNATDAKRASDSTPAGVDCGGV